MAFAVVSAKLTGSPDTSGWAQVHDFTPTEPEKYHSRGRLFAVVATGRHEAGVDAVSAGRELLSRLHEEYFGGGEGSAFAILEASIEHRIGPSAAFPDGFALVFTPRGEVVV